jgi:transposase
MYEKIKRKYLNILIDGNRECGDGFIDTGGVVRPGRRARTKERNLIDRLLLRHADVILFAKVFEATFTNNLAERDIRMIKLYLKISGLFRTEKDAADFLLLRGYLSTCKKNGVLGFESFVIIANNSLPKFIVTYKNSPKELAAKIDSIKKERKSEAARFKEEKQKAKVEAKNKRKMAKNV